MNKPTPFIEAATTRDTTRNLIFGGLALLFCSGLAVGADLNIKAMAPHFKAKAPRPASVKKPIGNDAINTALVKAVLAGDDLSIRAALSNGADVDTTIFINYGGQKPTLSAVTIATLLGDVTALRYLLDAGARVERSCDIGFLISVLQPLNSILPETGERKAVFDNIMRSQPELRCDLIGRYRLDPAR